MPPQNETELQIEHSNNGKSVSSELPADNNTDTPPQNEMLENETKEASNNAVWECNPEICFVSQDMIDGVTALLQKTVSTSSNNSLNYYLNLDNCDNPVRNGCLGHPMNCHLNTTCNSLLRPARILSCHYPFLRTSVYKLYDLRRLSFAVRNVQQARTSGTYVELERAVDGLSMLAHKSGVSTEDGQQCEAGNSAPVSEAAVMQQFGKALRTVTNIRDTYVTQACDVCDQLRKDLSTLGSYEDKKGFSSDKMTLMIDLLYQKKTQHEDIAEFLNTMLICKYCADKLRGNNDVARCSFNKLQVVPTPECIQELNIFEKTLIKYCLTCITVVRLGQVSNTFRPRTELNAALKGRIAYLPLDLTANASFVPDVLNADSLVLLVGGQPTKSHKVWTSVVDLRKVHKALMWLRENNPLYEQIPAYTVQDMEKIIEQRVSAGRLTNDNASDNSLLKRLNEAAKSHLYESFSVQPISNEFPADTLIDYQLDKVNGQSSNIFDADLDLKAYPELFPTGENGMKDATRTVNIGTSDFIKSRLLNKHPKFRLNIDYLFHSFQVQEISNMCHSVGHMLRTVTGNNMTAEQLYSRLTDKDGELHSKMFALMANLRGSREYFSKLGMDVRWMIRHLGPPTLFVTCSAAEWFSEPFIAYLRQINSSVPNVGSMTPAEVCAMDPVNVSIHFNKKWKAIFQHLIQAKEQPIFGEVVDYFWRVEYQCRGAPHVHCLLWVKDAPVLGQSSPEDVKAYLSKIVTCSMPDAADSPTLHELVTRFQRHKCNKYCRKLYKQNGKFYQKCRFGFPRPTKSTTELNDYIDCLAVIASKQPRKRLYNLKRSEAEVNINDYNAALLMANQSNVDVQFIGHLGSRLPYYICDYMTKNEKSEQDDMWRDIYSSTKSLGSNAMSFLLKSVKSRQVGANEAADRLLGHKLFSKSRQTRFADLQSADKVKRVLKPISELKALVKNSPDSSELFYNHWVLDVYPARPEKLETASLMEVMSCYEKDKAGKDKGLKMEKLGLYLRRRVGKPYIVTHKTVNPNESEEMKQTYFHNLLKLFVPWRAETDICPAGMSYSERFEQLSSEYPDMVAYHERHVHLETQAQKISDAVHEKQQEQKLGGDDGDKAAEEDALGALAGCQPDHLQIAMQDVLEAHQTAVRKDANTDDLQRAYEALNVDQQRIVDKVVHKVCIEQQSIHLFCSGQGGTGKSRVIDVLDRMVSSKCSGNIIGVIVTAPTGLAAFNVAGTTIHRTFALPVEHGKPADYSRLGQDQLNIIRQMLKGLKLLIIDELSMVSSLTLMYIHLRLTEVMASNEPFGGISLVCFGDLLQLPPVKGNHPFTSVSFWEAKQRLGSVASVDLWQMFTYEELTINMRQSGDLRYGELLSSARVGILSDEDVQLLKQRMINADSRATVAQVCKKYNELSQLGEMPIILMPRTAQCDEVNMAILSKLGSPVQEVPAVDTLDTVVDRNTLPKIQQAYEKVQEDVTRTAGLEKTLNLCLGAKVMLKKNKDVEAGLVNGSMGTVVGLEIKEQTVQAVEVNFHRIDRKVKIQRESCSFEVLKGIYYTRKQFPLMLSFAITIHKSQGLSLSCAIVDAGSSCFGCGMVYVALSRVTTLSGLHLIDFDRSKLQSDSKAVAEYNRLRSLYTPHLEQLPSVTKQCKRRNVQDKSHCKGKQRNVQDKDHCKGKQRNVRDKIHCKGKQRNVRDKDHCKSKQCNVQDKSHCKGKRVKTQHKVNSDNEQAVQEPCSPTNSNQQQVALPVFQYSDISSLDEEFQTRTCAQLNLRLFPANKHSVEPAWSDVTRNIQSVICKHTNMPTLTQIHNISGIGGNCLFRALSLGVTRSESQHDIIRAYVVNHMLDSDTYDEMRAMFDGSGEDYTRHLAAMQTLGEWGTEQEIVAAAHLFNCSIMCFSQYGQSGQYCLQHFPPHFARQRQCTNSCHHQTMYLVNSSGLHYNLAVVSVGPDVEP